MKLKIYVAVIHTLIFLALLLYTAVHYRHFVQADRVAEMELEIKAYEKRYKQIEMSASSFWMHADHNLEEANKIFKKIQKRRRRGKN